MSRIAVMGTRTTNAEMVKDLAQLGYLRAYWITLDVTYGLGRFWNLWRPQKLTKSDLYVEGPGVQPWDYTALPLDDRLFDVVVFDPPYKLNGTSTGDGCSSSDADYGVTEYMPWQQRHANICAGIAEGARVARRTLVVKCQDQVCSGRKRWQTREFADCGEAHGWRLADQLHVSGSRPQKGRQIHAQQDYSTALVFKRRGR